MMSLKSTVEKLRFKKLVENAIIPQKGSKLAAGYDLHSCVDTVIPAKGKGLVKTGLAVAVPQGSYGRVAPRSGLTWKNFIDVGAGVVDSDYRGELCVILFNFGETDFPINQGDRIAQFIIEKITETEVEETDNLDDTERGEGGFGSTGVSSNYNKSDQSSSISEESAKKQNGNY